MCQLSRVVLLTALQASVQAAIPAQDLKCEPIKLELCTDYNSTGMPNLMGHQLQVLLDGKRCNVYSVVVLNYMSGCMETTKEFWVGY